MSEGLLVSLPGIWHLEVGGVDVHSTEMQTPCLVDFKVRNVDWAKSKGNDERRKEGEAVLVPCNSDARIRGRGVETKEWGTTAGKMLG